MTPQNLTGMTSGVKNTRHIVLHEPGERFQELQVTGAIHAQFPRFSVGKQLQATKLRAK